MSYRFFICSTTPKYCTCAIRVIIVHSLTVTNWEITQSECDLCGNPMGRPTGQALMFSHGVNKVWHKDTVRQFRICSYATSIGFMSRLQHTDHMTMVHFIFMTSQVAA